MPILNCPIRAHAISAPNAVAIYLPTIKITYAQLDQMIVKRAGELQHQGIGLSDPVAFYDSNNLTLIVSLFAIIRLGAIFCPISQYLPNKEIHTLLLQTGIGYLYHENDVKIEGIKSIKLNFDFYFELEAESDNELANLPSKKLTPVSELAQVFEQIEISAAIAATIIFTSGSTGHPKAAVHSFNNHYYSALGSQSVIPLKPNDCWLASLPLHHIGGLAIVMRSFIAQASIALVDRKALFNSLQNYPITHASLVPTQIYRLLEQLQQDKLAQHPHNKAISLKYLLLGGAPISRDLLTKANALGFNTFHSYGLTEMCSQVTTSPSETPYFSTALPYRQWKLDNGEILLKGETLFIGYMVKGKIQSPCINGWFYSKDLAELTPNGLNIIGRKDNMFIVGGENYQPEIIEKILMASALVKNALIVAIEDDEFGKIPVAFIEWIDTANIPALKKYLTATISRIQIPKHFILWPTPKTETLKPNRKWYQNKAQQFILNNTHM